MGVAPAGSLKGREKTGLGREDLKKIFDEQEL